MTGEPGAWGAAPARQVTWFGVAAAVGDRLVPSRSDWVLLHVRRAVLEVAGRDPLRPLEQAGVGPPREGEPLSIVTFRHRDPDLEVALRGLVEALDPRVGDPYGSGRVTLTGRSRFASRVDPAHLRAIAKDEDNLALLQRLDLGGAVIAPVVADGVVLGALNLVLATSDGSTAGGEARTQHAGAPLALGADALAEAEDLGRRIGSALDASRSVPPASPDPSPAGPRARWEPEGLTGNPVAAARRWVRRTLPELVRRPVRDDLAADLDLVVSELCGNAVRHTGALGEVVLEVRPGTVRLVVADRDDRDPHLRHPDRDVESGRGLMIVAALSSAWATEHDRPGTGKRVWAELPLSDDPGDLGTQPGVQPGDDPGGQSDTEE